MIGRLNHVAIVVPDLDAAAAVYRDTLGARVSPPQISMLGLAEPNAEPRAAMCEALSDVMEGLPAPMRHDDNALRDTARRVLRRELRERFGKRPLIEIQLVRL